MKRSKPQLYTSPISLPEAKVGEFEVKHSYLKGSAPLIGMRQAYTRGVAPVNVALDEPLKIHNLLEGDSLWMTDSPEELNQIGESLREFRPRGRVLVGGLGLGILAKVVSQLAEVENVLVIEKSAEIVKLCRPPGSEYNVLVTDIREFVKNASHYKFDCAMLDTWQGTSEGTWWEEVFPLRRELRHQGVSRVWCWAEDIMLGQIKRAILVGNRGWKYKKLPVDMTPASVNTFLSDIGSPTWEKAFGDMIV